jgi:hypothetical protein
MAFDNGLDQRVQPRATRPAFKYGAAAEQVAVLANGYELRAVVASGAAPRVAVVNGQPCLKHRVQRLLVPSGRERIVVATGPQASRPVATVIRNAGSDAPPPFFPLGAPLLGAAAGDAAGHVLLFTERAAGAGASTPGAASVYLVAPGETAPTPRELDTDVRAAWSTLNGNFVALEDKAPVLLELGSHAARQKFWPGAASCGLTLYAGDACHFFAAAALGEQDCSGTPDPDAAALDAASETADAGPERALECAERWTPAVVSADGCVMASVDSASGALLAVGVPGAGCAMPLALRYLPRQDGAAGTDGRFDLVLSPDGRFAAVWANDSTSVPVRIVELATSDFFDTSDVQPRRVEFGCDAGGRCTLWTFHSGYSGADPEVTAWPTDKTAATHCPARLHIAGLSVWSATEATYSAGDAPQFELGRVNLEREPHCQRLPLSAEPLCVGHLGAAEDFVCSRDADGEVLIAGWSPPTLTPRIGFSLDRRITGAACPEQEP